MNDEERDEHVAQTAVWLLAMACRRTPGERGFCGTYLIRVARRLKAAVRRSFTDGELIALGTLLPALYAEGKAALLNAPEEQRALWLRARAILPDVRRTTGRRSDDEDCAAIAADILGLGKPEAGDLWEIDIPEDAG